MNASEWRTHAIDTFATELCDWYSSNEFAFPRFKRLFDCHEGLRQQVQKRSSEKRDHEVWQRDISGLRDRVRWHISQAQPPEEIKMRVQRQFDAYKEESKPDARFDDLLANFLAQTSDLKPDLDNEQYTSALDDLIETWRFIDFKPPVIELLESAEVVFEGT